MSLLAALALLGGGCSASGDDGELSWRAEDDPFRLTFAHGGETVAEQAAQRMAYAVDGGARYRLTRLLSTTKSARGSEYSVATDEPGRTAVVAVVRTERGLRVEWRFEPADGVVEVFEAFQSSADEHFLGSGQRSEYVDLAGRAVPLQVWFDCGSSIPVPFYMSTAGYAIALDTVAMGQMQFRAGQEHPECWAEAEGMPDPCRPSLAPQLVQLCVQAGSLNYEVYAGSFPRMLSAYASHVGPTPLPPVDQLALVKWRDEVGSAEELFDDVDQLRRRGIPIGWVLLDNPWEEGCFGTLRFSPETIPDPAGTIAALHERGVRFMLWVAPYLRRDPSCPDAGYEPGELIEVTGADVLAVDLTDEAARRRFEERLREVFALGVDGVKGDRGDHLAIAGVQLAGGPGTDEQNRYPNRFAESVVRVLRERRGSDFATMFRSATAAAQGVLPGIWAGDQQSSFAGLEKAIRMGQTAAMSGFPVWGSDVGGYIAAGLPVTAELIVRWAQFAAVTPIFEIGGQGLNARFWELGEQTAELVRQAAVLHYELVPYLYELIRRASRRGAPVLRPLGFRYPEDERAWEPKHDRQLLIGPDLLAAPVYTGTMSGNQTDGPPELAPAYLPSGEWLDLFSGERLQGPAEIARPTRLDEFPLYLRAGRAIPFNLRTPDVWREPWRVDDLLRDGRAGWLYAPGPETVEVRSEHEGRFEARPDGRRLTVRLASAPAEAQVLVLTAERPRSVSIAGRAAQELAPGALRAQGAGWTFVHAPFGGVLLKLAPADGAVEAVLELAESG